MFEIVLGFIWGSIGCVSWRSYNHEANKNVADFTGTMLCSILWPVYLAFKYLESKA